MNEFDWFRNAKFIVLRAAPGFTLPFEKDGLWLERAQIPRLPLSPRSDAVEAKGEFSGRYERREDGAWAEVYEISW